MNGWIILGLGIVLLAAGVTLDIVVGDGKGIGVIAVSCFCIGAGLSHLRS